MALQPLCFSVTNVSIFYSVLVYINKYNKELGNNKEKNISFFRAVFIEMQYLLSHNK